MGRSPEWYQETLGDGRPIIIYLHGNVGTRWEESGRIETLELSLVGITWLLRLMGLSADTMHTQGLWVRLDESEGNMFVCIHCSHVISTGP